MKVFKKLVDINVNIKVSFTVGFLLFYIALISYWIHLDKNPVAWFESGYEDYVSRFNHVSLLLGVTTVIVCLALFALGLGLKLGKKKR